MRRQGREMRWLSTVLFFLMLSTICAEPEPKKYKPETKDRNKLTNSTLTEDEIKFLREVETKFGIKSDVPISIESKKNETEESNTTTSETPRFPAVIAIEIVNDTDSKLKDKRTIDANLGYGYRTNNGYTYTYFGKPTQEKGKFMIYPYSQEDIPGARPNVNSIPNAAYSQQISKYSTNAPNVEIQPSKAFELVPMNQEQQNSYHHTKPVTEFKTEYENIKGLETPPPPYTVSNNRYTSVHTAPPATLYTTYNGEQLSSLSGQFPVVMPNYFVDPSQLLKTPQYQSVGLTQDHLRPHGQHLEQRVVPVLVLRIPSSSLRNPTAQLYPNLPQNYPLSQHLNNVNLQELVNQYFKKIGYPVSPQLIAYQNSPVSTPIEYPAASSGANYGPQQYADPYVQPSYTQADYSGVQYSAVQPVMAKYPSSYTDQQYFVPQARPLYQSQPVQQQQYEYQYQHVPQTAVQQQQQTQAYYVQPQYQQQTQEVIAQDIQIDQHHVLDQQTNIQDTATNPEYGVPQQSTSQETSEVASVEYETTQNQDVAQYGHAQPETTQYESKTVTPEYLQHLKQQRLEYSPKKAVSQEYGSTNLDIPVFRSSNPPQSRYGPPKEVVQTQEYYSPQQPVQKETAAIYSPPSDQNYHLPTEADSTQGYVYQKQVENDSASKTIVISENYPSKDHTIATVLPYSHKPGRKQNTATVQSVDYVTPVPYSAKYQSQYKVMVPQMVLKYNTNEKVSYVNSHSLPAHYITNSESNPEQEYTVGSQYVPPVGTQKPPSYPRNYHTHPKRMVKTDNKSESNTSSTLKKQNGKSEKKKSS